jgi:indole-3-glycerol phosphate synthase
MPSLDKRVSSIRQAVEERRGARPLEELEQAVAALEPVRPFTESIVGEDLAFVVRVESADAGLVDEAEGAELSGLAASLGPLGQLAQTSEIPLLLTDVVIDPYQLYEARLAGAGGVVLIAAAFDDEDDQLADLYGLAMSIGLDVIVEVADEDEIAHVLDVLDPDSFLIRNRDVERGGPVDFERTFSLLEEIPAGKLILSQGGIRTRDAALALERVGVDGAILGPWAAEQGLVDTLKRLRGESR